MIGDGPPPDAAIDPKLYRTYGMVPRVRTSSRNDILDAALQVVDAEGGADLTYDSVAKQAGLTKAGLMYHFPSKEDMMIAVIEHVLTRWRSELEAELGVPLEETTLAERVRAFVTFAGEGGVTRGEFVIFFETLRRPALAGPCRQYLQQWFGFGPSTDPTPLMLTWFAANGMWIAEATGIVEINAAQRTALVDAMLRMVGGDER